MRARRAVFASLLGVVALPLAPARLSVPAAVEHAPIERGVERGLGRAVEGDVADPGAGRGIGGAADLFLAGDDQRALLMRWNRLTPREQGELRERFERFKEIDAEERERLAQRGKRLDLLARHLYRELPDEDRARMDALPAAKRRELMREMAADKARDVGQRILDKLPPGVRRRLEQASPEDRARFMEEFRARRRERMGDALVRLGEQLDIDDSIIKRIRNLPDEQRGRKFLEFLQRRALVEVGRRGLPAGLDIERWHEIGSLPGDEFFEAVMELRETYPDFAMPPSEIRELDEPLRRLVFAGRSRHSERIELSEWSPGERRRELLRRRRGRVEQALREFELLSSEELAELASLPDGPFLAEVRRRTFRSVETGKSQE